MKTAAGLPFTVIAAVACFWLSAVTTLADSKQPAENQQNQPKDNPRPESFYDEASSMKFVWVEGGCYSMGSLYGQPDEYPVHEVCVDGFWLGEIEVTQAQWQKILGNNPSTFVEPVRPVTDVTWKDATVYLSQLSMLTKRNYRLPTEAEWEFAAQGGIKSKNHRFSGSGLINEVAWFSENCQREPAPVKAKRPNELGLYDMSGNVAEWCADWYRSASYQQSQKVNPQGAEYGLYRSVRGGSWQVGRNSCSVSARAANHPSGASPSIGLRVAISGDQVDVTLLEKNAIEATTKETNTPGPAANMKDQNQTGANL